MKSLISFYSNLLAECGERCCISTANDLKTVVGRVEDEGVSFLTITLTNYAKDFQKSLDHGFVAPTDFLGFRRKKSSGLPLFLGGFLELIFDPSSGQLLHHPNVDAIFCVRQLTLVFGKIAIDCTEERNRQAIKGYLQAEQDIRESELAFLDSSLYDDFLGLVVFFGERHLLSWTRLSTTEMLFQSTDRAKPLTDLLETTSIDKWSGPTDSRSISLLGKMLSRPGDIINISPVCDSWTLAKRGLLRSL